jgi:hypothetical protein
LNIFVISVAAVSFNDGYSDPSIFCASQVKMLLMMFAMIHHPVNVAGVLMPV